MKNILKLFLGYTVFFLKILRINQIASPSNYSSSKQWYFPSNSSTLQIFVQIRAHAKTNICLSKLIQT